MISILALSVVGSWTYAGFVADPTPAPAPPLAAVVPSASASALPRPKEKKESVPSKDSGRPSKETLPSKDSAGPSQARAKAETPPPPIAANPTLYRANDALGQTWEHPDPAYLASFIEAHNRSFATYYSASPPPLRSSRCVTGRCN